MIWGIWGRGVTFPSVMLSSFPKEQYCLALCELALLFIFTVPHPVLFFSASVILWKQLRLSCCFKDLNLKHEKVAPYPNSISTWGFELISFYKANSFSICWAPGCEIVITLIFKLKLPCTMNQESQMLWVWHQESPR